MSIEKKSALKAGLQAVADYRKEMAGFKVEYEQLKRSNPPWFQEHNRRMQAISDMTAQDILDKEMKVILFIPRTIVGAISTAIEQVRRK